MPDNFVPIDTISPREALQRQAQGARLLDVREDGERAAGMAQGAIGIPLARLLDDPAAIAPDPHAPLLLICAMGGRSLRAAQALAANGYIQLASVDGGTQRWIADGLPMGDAIADTDFLERYSRHLLLPQIGLAGQRRLETSRVLLVGAGGLGSPAAFYLAAAGVGSIVLADDDVVDRSNLQRQILHTEARIGTPKIESARIALEALNPRVRIEAVPERVGIDNVDRLLADIDVAIDGSDSFALRYLLSDACVKHAKPLVYGAVQRFEGQVSVFDAGRHRGIAPCYRCLFPLPPRPQDAPSCSEAGVLGVLPGIIGLLQANEAIKLLLRIGDSLAGRLLSFDALATTFRETRLPADPDCTVCAPDVVFPGYIDYGRFCAA